MCASGRGIERLSKDQEEPEVHRTENIPYLCLNTAQRVVERRHQEKRQQECEAAKGHTESTEENSGPCPHHGGQVASDETEYIHGGMSVDPGLASNLAQTLQARDCKQACIHCKRGSVTH